MWGKPSVAHAKVINTVNEDGNPVGMNAQQYAVLVMDVPNFTRQRATYALLGLQNPHVLLRGSSEVWDLMLLHLQHQRQIVREACHLSPHHTSSTYTKPHLLQ